MRPIIALSALMVGSIVASTEEASAVIYCQYINYPVGCVARPGVVLRPRPVARAVASLDVVALPGSTYLALQQGGFTLADRGDASFAESAERMAVPVPSTASTSR